MFKRCFLDDTLFVIPYVAQVHLRNRVSYRSAVKCVVKRKKSAFRSYAKLKIEICPQSGPFLLILSHLSQIARMYVCPALCPLTSCNLCAFEFEPNCCLTSSGLPFLFVLHLSPTPAASPPGQPSSVNDAVTVADMSSAVIGLYIGDSCLGVCHICHNCHHQSSCQHYPLPSSRYIRCQ